MFEFTTLTVFNSIKKENVQKGKRIDKKTNVIVGDDPLKPEVRIGNTRFNKENVLNIHKKVHTVENLASVEFDITNLISLITAEDKDVKEGNYRIVLYIGLSMNSQDSFYANDFVYKGKPLYVEFYIKPNDETKDIANRIKKIADKYTLFVAQERILDITVEKETKVKFSGVNGYLIIKKAVLQKYNPNAIQIDCCNNNGDFIDIITGVPVIYTTDEEGRVEPGTQTLDSDGLRDLASDGSEVPINPGIEAFGDYNWIIHNLRLPTLANTYFWSVNKSEMPVVGGEYNQYVIRMCKERDGIAGEVVGQRATSVTTHVLYVLDQGNNIATIETELKKLIDGDFEKDADEGLAEPYKGAQ